MKLYRMLPPAFAALVLTAAPALGHHAFQAAANPDAPITLKGKVRTVDWVNPHTRVHLTVAEPGKPEQEWLIQGGTPNSMLRRGVCRNRLTTGTELIVRGWVAKNAKCEMRDGRETCTAVSNSMTFPDGKTASTGYGLPPAGSVEPAPC